MKMCIAENIYSEMIDQAHFKKLLRRVIRKRPVTTGLYVVTRPLFDAGIMEIYDYNELLQPYYRKRKGRLDILAISTSREGARELVKDIIDDMYDNIGTIDVVRFFGLR